MDDDEHQLEQTPARDVLALSLARVHENGIGRQERSAQVRVLIESAHAELEAAHLLAEVIEGALALGLAVAAPLAPLYFLLPGRRERVHPPFDAREDAAPSVFVGKVRERDRDLRARLQAALVEGRPSGRGDGRRLGGRFRLKRPSVLVDSDTDGVSAMRPDLAQLVEAEVLGQLRERKLLEGPSAQLDAQTRVEEVHVAVELTHAASQGGATRGG